MTKEEALRRAAPVLAAMVRRDLERLAKERAASSPARSASPAFSQGARGEIERRTA